MKHEVPPFLAKQRLASLTLALVLFGLEILQLVLLMLLVVVRAKSLDPSMNWLLMPAAGTLALNSWLLGRAVKNTHFLWLYGRWPKMAPKADGGEEQSQVLGAAKHAFFEGEFARVPGLLSRLDRQGREDEVAAALGRSLAMDGRCDEAAEALARFGSPDEGLRRLRPGRRFGLGQGPYFTPADAQWAQRLGRLTGLGLLLLALSAGQISVFYLHADEQITKVFKGFDGADFQVATHGRFTIHYHDQAFHDLVLPIAEDALQHHLDFLKMPAEAFKDGQIQLYLCDSREEYVRRAPNTPAWEAASALPREDSVFLYRMDPAQKVYFEVVVAHELCHLVYHKLVPKGTNDSWLNEGLAEHMGYRFAFDRAGMPRQAWLMRHSFKGLRERALPFRTFFKTNPRLIENTEVVSVFYKQGFSVVYVLLENFGRDPFLAFLNAYGAKPEMDPALQQAYTTIRDVDELSSVWSLFFPKEEASEGKQ